MAKRELKQSITSDLIREYLLNKMTFLVSDQARNIDNSLKKLGKLSNHDEIEKGVKNVDYQIKIYLDKK